MNKITKMLIGASLVLGLATVTNTTTVSAKDSGKTQAMYRLYNPNNKEHFYTASFNEAKTLINQGWGKYEGVAWYAPTKSSKPIYRLYNKTLKDHHYTGDRNEIKVLTSKHGWVDEGVSFYSSDTKAVPVYRAFNKTLTSGSHNYTKDAYEQKVLTTQRGWKNEGVAWYGSKVKAANDNDILVDLNNGYKGIDEVKFSAMTTTNRRNWVRQIIKWAVPLAAEARLYPSLMVAQAVTESGWGESGLAVNANNLFGVKEGTGWTGAVYFTVTGEATTANKQEVVGFKTEADAKNPAKQATKFKLAKKGTYYYIRTNFRKYSSQHESLKNYVSVLSYPRYVNVHRDKAKNYKQAAEAVHQAGYATSPTYAPNLIKFIEQYNLQALD
jgi:flagellum-specific peptidoglycan hydrolase FlgJ